MERSRPLHVIETPIAPQQAEWGAGKCTAFRFIFAYLVLYSLPFPLNAIPGLETVAGWYDGLWDWAVPWFARSILQIPYALTPPNGSGDTTWNFVQVLLYVLIAAALCAVWSALDRRRRDYTWPHEWLRVYVRYVLFVTMLSYGLSKVFLRQFPAPHFERLVQPYGESSPMGLLWTFMGASPAYQFFAGAAELLGGTLLLFRRTTMLGALVCTAVLINVVMLNFCYDVPVKLYSSHLLLMSVFLLAPDARRLVDFLLCNRAVDAPPAVALFQSRKLRIVYAVSCVLFVAACVANQIQQRRIRLVPPDKVPQAFVGEYEVTSFMRNGVAQPPLLTDAAQWRQFRIVAWGAAGVKCIGGTERFYLLALDLARQELTLVPTQDRTARHVLHYTGAPESELCLQGTIGDELLSVTLRKSGARKFLLVERGFHWINEQPFNR